MYFFISKISSFDFAVTRRHASGQYFPAFSSASTILATVGSIDKLFKIMVETFCTHFTQKEKVQKIEVRNWLELLLLSIWIICIITVIEIIWILWIVWII